MTKTNADYRESEPIKTTRVRTFSKNDELVKERRTLITSKALRLFLEKGFDKTTMRDLAAACELSEGALYRYIGNKTDILHLFISSTKVNELQNYLKELGEIGTQDALVMCIKQYYTWQDETAEHNIFFNREINQFSLVDKRLLMTSQSDYIHFFEQLIKKGIKEKIYQTPNPFLLAHNIVMAGFDWSLRKWFLQKYLTIDEYINLQTNMFLHLLMPDNTGKSAIRKISPSHLSNC